MKYYFVFLFVLSFRTAAQAHLHAGCLVKDRHYIRALHQDSSYFWFSVLMQDENCLPQTIEPNNRLQLVSFYLGRETGRYGHRYAIGHCLKAEQKVNCTVQPFDH